MHYLGQENINQNTTSCHFVCTSGWCYGLSVIQRIISSSVNLAKIELSFKLQMITSLIYKPYLAIYKDYKSISYGETPFYSMMLKSFTAKKLQIEKKTG